MDLPQNTLMWWRRAPRPRRPGLRGSRDRRVVGTPFARLVGRQPSSSSGGFVIGWRWAWCSYRVRDRSSRRSRCWVRRATFISRPSWSPRVRARAVVPLLFIALAGGGLVHRVQSVRSRAPLYRQIGGVVLLLMAIRHRDELIRLLAARRSRLHERSAKEDRGSTSIRKQLNALKARRAPKASPVRSCRAQSSSPVW